MPGNIAIVGGCGHVGLPLGLALAQAGQQVTLLDINKDSVNLINDKILPFKEEGAQDLMNKYVGNKLTATTNAEVLRKQNVVIFVTGTPVDAHLNPRIQDVTSVIEHYAGFLNSNQLIVLRSTVFPGTTEVVANILEKKLGSVKVAFCPERIAQGYGIAEISELPQIVSGNCAAALSEAKDLFLNLTKKTVELEPKEAELAKLITNSWRYLEFAIANQFYMMTEAQGFDFHKLYGAIVEDYPRAKHYARPGLAAGPCLFKDTMQISAFHKNNFFLGQSAMLVNEGLPNFLVEQLEEKMGSLKGKRIAILGMTFKPNNDDVRESLSFKLKKVLQFKMADVMPSDPYLEDSVKLEDALEKADGVILGVPHREYVNLKISKPFVDCWGVWRGK